MNKITFFLLAFFLCSLLNNSYSQSGPMAELYSALLENDRFLKNATFSEPAKSPIPEIKLNEFEGLNYYPVDPEYKVEASLHRDEIQEAVELKLTDGSAIELIKYGTVAFRLNGKILHLSVFRDQNLPELNNSPGQFVIPFADVTSGTETIATGRYLTFRRPMDMNDFELDFNTAFNPWSAYNSGYTGIVAPEENHIPFEIMAGEKVLSSTPE